MTLYLKANTQYKHSQLIHWHIKIQTHMGTVKCQWFYGLSIHYNLPWCPRNAYVLNLFVWKCGVHLSLHIPWMCKESQPLQHPPAYQIRCMLACQSVLGVRNKTTHTDSSGTGAFCMHSVMYDPITLIVVAVKGEHRAVEGHSVKPALAPCTWLHSTNSHTHTDICTLALTCARTHKPCTLSHWKSR